MVRVAYRPQSITIDVVKPNTTPIVSLVVQRVELDDEGNVTAITPGEERVYRNALRVLTETVNVNDPVTGLSGAISIAGMQQTLTVWANRWIGEDMGCPIDPDTGWSTCQE